MYDEIAPNLLKRGSERSASSHSRCIRHCGHRAHVVSVQPRGNRVLKMPRLAILNTGKCVGQPVRRADKRSLGVQVKRSLLPARGELRVRGRERCTPPVRVGKNAGRALGGCVGFEDRRNVLPCQERIVASEPSLERNLVRDVVRNEERALVRSVRGQHADAVQSASSQQLP